MQKKNETTDCRHGFGRDVHLHAFFLRQKEKDDADPDARTDDSDTKQAGGIPDG